MAKIDYQISDKNSIFGRFMSGDLTQGSTYDGKNPLSINTYGYPRLRLRVHYREIPISSAPTWSVPSALGANRTNVVKIPDNYGTWADFRSERRSPLGGNIIAVTATGAFTIGGGTASPGASA